MKLVTDIQLYVYTQILKFVSLAFHIFNYLKITFLGHNSDVFLDQYWAYFIQSYEKLADIPLCFEDINQ